MAPAADTDKLAQCLRHAFVRMYEEHDVLEEFRQAMAPLTTEELPPVPEKGNLSISAVLDSQFFFA